MIYLKNVRRNHFILLWKIGLPFLTHSPGLYLDKLFLPPAIRSFLHCAFLLWLWLCGEENVKENILQEAIRQPIIFVLFWRETCSPEICASIRHTVP